MNKTLFVNGDTLRILLAGQGIKYKDAASNAGVSPFAVSRWTKSGMHRTPQKALKRLASMLNTTTEVLASDPPSPMGLTPREQDWLDAYRKLPPLQQAKARVAIEDMLSNGSHHE